MIQGKKVLEGWMSKTKDTGGACEQGTPAQMLP